MFSSTKLLMERLSMYLSFVCASLRIAHGRTDCLRLMRGHNRLISADFHFSIVAL